MNRLLCLLLSTIALCCEDGWTQFNDHCYKRFSTNQSMNTLQSSCSAHGANLASLTSTAEIEFIKNMTKTGIIMPWDSQPVIGAYKAPQQPWIWLDGTPFTQHHLFQRGVEGEKTYSYCAYLQVDTTGSMFKKGILQQHEMSFTTGDFVGLACIKTVTVFICKKKDMTDKITEKKCGPTWNSVGSSCYKYFSEPAIPIGQANEYCKQHGANLVSITTDQEKEHIIGMTRMGKPNAVNWQPAVGCYRESPNNPWKWYDGTPFDHSGFFYAGQNDTDNCCMLMSDVPLKVGVYDTEKADDYYFNKVYGKILKAKCSWPAHSFVCEKKACDLSVSIFSEGKCVCIQGFIDIMETTPLKSKYRKGEKCVPDMCHSKKDASILFMLDSSKSITSKHWPKLVKFATNTALKLPTKYRVGFLKFSSNVTFEKFVKPGWNEKKIKKAVPTGYDGGGTNTPAALKEAKKIFGGIKGKNKIAVLITDGLPFDDKEYESEKEALNATTTAAKELRKDGVRLIVLGAGHKICDNEEQVKKWVRNPKEDYVLLRHNIDALKNRDVDKLLKMLCK